MDGLKGSQAVYLGLALWFGLCHQGIMGQNKMTVTASPSGRIKVGASVTLTCTAKGQYSGSTVTWTMKQASYEHRLGSDILNKVTQLMDVKVEESRLESWQMNAQSSGNKITVHNLTITGIKPEDTAIYGCAVEKVSETAWVNLAACANPEGPVCQCLEKAGWLAPDCYKEPPELEAVEKKYKTTITALIVFLVIAVLFGIGLAVMVGRDCMMRKYEKRKRAMQQRNAASHIRASYTETQRLEDPNETGSQASYEGAPRVSQLPPSYSTLQQHSNPAYAPEEDNLQHPEADRAAYPRPRPHRDEPHGASPRDYQPQGGRMTVEAETHNAAPVPPERIRGRRAMMPSSSSNPPTPKSPGSESPNPYHKQEYPTANASRHIGFSHLERPPAQVSNGDVRKSPGYMDREPTSYGPYNPGENPGWNRPDGQYSESPGTWSTKSAGEAFQYPDLHGARGTGPANLDPRNVYSEGPKQSYGQERTHYTEPRKLDFVHNRDVYNANNNKQGAYIDKTDTVV